MIRPIVAIGLLMLSGCAALPIVAAGVGITAGATTIAVNAPRMAEEMQRWVDPRALELPPQP